MLNVYLFGSLRVVSQDQQHFVSGINAKLLSLLALNHQGMSRSRLAGHLWPNSSEAQARQLLSNSLYRLKQLLGSAAEHIETDGHSVRLHDVQLDYQRFCQLSQSADFDDWLESINLYQDDLLLEEDAPWLEDARQHCRKQYLSTLKRVCDQLESENQLADALVYAQRWLIADPYNEPLYVRVMQYQHRLGRHMAALESYHRLGEVLHDTFAAQPQAESQALAEQIQEHIELHQEAKKIRAERFIGRKQERAQFIAQLNQLEQQGGWIVLQGEAGMGKSRLLDGFEEVSHFQQVTLARAQSRQDATSLFQPLDALLQALTARQRLGRLSAALSPMVMQVLAPLLPRLRKGQRPLEHRLSAMPTALEQLLRQLCQNTKLVLLLDDVQWASASTWDLLQTLIALTQHLPILVVTSFRPDEMRNHAMWDAFQELVLEHQPVQLHLEGFSADEAQCLFESLSIEQIKSAEDIATYMNLSQGNPFILKELILNQGKAIKLSDALDERLAALTALEYEALVAATILGTDLSHQAWQAMLSQPLPVASLITKRFIYETDQSYGLSHDLLRNHIYQQLSDEQKQQTHAKAAMALQGLDVAKANLGMHFEAAQRWSEAAHYYQQACKEALRFSLITQARSYQAKFASLLNHYEATASSHLSSALLDLHIAWFETGSSAPFEKLESLIHTLEPLDAPELLIAALRLKMKYLNNQGKVDELETLIEDVMQHIEALGDTDLEMGVLNEVIHYAIHTLHGWDKPLELAQRMLDLAQQKSTRPEMHLHALMHLATIYAIRFNALQETQHLDKLPKLIDKAYTLIDDHPILAPLKPELMSRQAIAYENTADLEAAYFLLKELLDVHRQMTGDAHGIETSLQSLASVCRKIGQNEEAVMYAEELVHYVKTTSADDDLDRYYLSATVLARCYVAAGQLEQAEACLQPTLTWLERNKAVTDFDVSQVYAALCHETERYEEGYQAMSRCLSYIQPSIFLAEQAYYAYHTGRHDEAKAHLAQAHKQLSTSSPNIRYAAIIHYLDFCVTAQPLSLIKARRYLHNFAKRISDKTLRHDFLHHEITSRKVNKAWDTLISQGHSIKLLAKSSESQAANKAYVDVIWTREDAKDKDILKEQGKVALRHHRIRRFMEEADLQDAVVRPTDLAKALKVSQRTIERDLKILVS